MVLRKYRFQNFFKFVRLLWPQSLLFLPELSLFGRGSVTKVSVLWNSCPCNSCNSYGCAVERQFFVGLDSPLPNAFTQAHRHWPAPCWSAAGPLAPAGACTPPRRTAAPPPGRNPPQPPAHRPPSTEHPRNENCRLERGPVAWPAMSILFIKKTYASDILICLHGFEICTVSSFFQKVSAYARGPCM